MTEGRTVWVRDGEIDGYLEAGAIVTAAKPLSDWCLRGDDGSEAIEAGTLLEVVDVRPWGASEARELTDMHDALDEVGAEAAAIMQAANELTLAGLWEWGE